MGFQFVQKWVTMIDRPSTMKTHLPQSNSLGLQQSAYVSCDEPLFIDFWCSCFAIFPLIPEYFCNNVTTITNPKFFGIDVHTQLLILLP